MHIIHTCSSVLLRPNGITRYINLVMDLQIKMGHNVYFVSDARPNQPLPAVKKYFRKNPHVYVPNMKDGHVWLQVDDGIVNSIIDTMATAKMANLVICHDLHSFLAAKEIYVDGIFVQHESDLLTEGSRYSYLSDEYLAMQKAEVESTSWKVGLTVNSTAINPKRPVYTPAPMILDTTVAEKTRGLLYVGDASERKGAREFMQMARDLGIWPTVITHEIDHNLFAGADIYSYGLDHQDAMREMIRRHKVAYIPSKNECPGLAALECAQYMPTIVDGQYAWTKYLEGTGVDIIRGSHINYYIKHFMTNSFPYDNAELRRWCEKAQQLWINLST